MEIGTIIRNEYNVGIVVEHEGKLMGEVVVFFKNKILGTKSWFDLKGCNVVKGKIKHEI